MEFLLLRLDDLVPWERLLNVSGHDKGRQCGGSVFLEVESSENFEGSLFLRFKELKPAKPLLQVKLYERSARGEWCDVVGWTDNEEEPYCSAQAQLVEDSGAGFAYLIFGGLCGIRLKPVDIHEHWSVSSPNQWGESHLLLADPGDLKFAE